jgi:hypothetical protein
MRQIRSVSVEILELPGIFPDPQTAKKAILA